MIADLIAQFIIGFFGLMFIVSTITLIYKGCKKIYEDCGGLVLIGLIVSIPVSIVLGKLILTYVFHVN